MMNSTAVKAEALSDRGACLVTTEYNNELLIRVAERYLYHSNYHSDNPVVQEMANKICEIEIYEMWALTQK